MQFLAQLEQQPIRQVAVKPTSIFVQAGAFSERGNAERLVAQLRAGGFDNPFIVSDQAGRRVLHRVRLGPLRDSDEFDRVKGRLLAAGVTNPQLVVDR